jgi:lambda family phage portal protein
MNMLSRIGAAVDRFVGIYDPVRGLRRQVARTMLSRAYEGASIKDGWRPKRAGASANADHRADAATLRARSRSLTQNVPYIAQGLRSLVASVVGTGIVPRWIGGDADLFDTLWKQWVPVCDADGRHDIYGIQAAAYRAMQQDGEVLIRLRPRLPSDRLPVPLQLQLLEIDWLDSMRTHPQGTSQVINGVQYDYLGRVEGYWLFERHPGEPIASGHVRVASYFVPAQNVIHLYTADRPGQGRGFPRISPVIARVRDLQTYEDAELQRKNLETRLSVVAAGNVAEMANPPSPGESVDTTAAKAGELGPLAGGQIMQIPGASQLTVVEPKVAPGYVEYCKYQLHIIAAGWGVTYSMMTGDTSDSSFSAERAARMNFQREAEMEQWVNFIPKFCDRVCRAFADAAELAGKVKRANYDVDHSTPKWGYVNPVQDVQADMMEISSGLSSFSEKLRQRGYKPDMVFREYQDDIEKLKAAGILDVLLLLQKGRVAEQVNTDDAPAKPAKPAKKKTA